MGQGQYWENAHKNLGLIRIILTGLKTLGAKSLKPIYQSIVIEKLKKKGS